MKVLTDSNKNFIKVAIIVLILMISNGVIYVLKPGVESVRKEQLKYAPAYIDFVNTHHKNKLAQVAADLALDSHWSSLDFNKIFDLNETRDHLFDKFPEIIKQDRPYRAPKSFFWVTDSLNQFVVGSPPGTFVYLNEVFTKHMDKIHEDHFYDDRDAFFKALCNATDHLDLTNAIDKNGMPAEWRFFESKDRRLGSLNSGIFNFSKNIVGLDGKILGKVSLKFDDSINYYLVYADLGEERRKNHYRYYFLINVFCVLVLWYLIPVWIYKDASNRGVKRPFVWAMLGVLSNVIALIFYVANRKQLESLAYCPHCEKNLPPGGDYCPYCSYNLKSSSCPSCQLQVESEWQYCSRCGDELQAKQKPPAT